MPNPTIKSVLDTSEEMIQRKFFIVMHRWIFALWEQAKLEIILTLHMQNVSCKWLWSRTILVCNVEPSSTNTEVRVILSQMKAFTVEPTVVKSWFCSDHARSRCYSGDRHTSSLAAEKPRIYQQSPKKKKIFTQKRFLLDHFLPFLSNLPISAFQFDLRFDQLCKKISYSFWP